uniref:Hypoxia up-regulated protein 1 n=1 Tax=Panagrolaimus davidi TaxID=227884 RepID=A0A914QLK9_9BILA
MALKIYENGALTQTINICEKGTTIMNIKIDKNGIFSIILKRKGINFRFFPFSKPIKKNRTIYKIPPKLVYYNKNLNAVGIDLGTSECYASVIRRNGPEGIVLDSKTNNRNLPSYVAIDELNEPCGQYVINRMERKPEFLAFDGKRLIGKEFDEIVIDPLWSFKVINYCEQIYLLFYDKENVPAVRSSTYILSCLLKQIKQKTDEFQGTNISEAIITIPSSFTEKQKDATTDAANIAGWETIHFLSEPIAALFACSYETDIPNKSIALLFDFGGGTTDICISKIFNGKIEILIESGDAFLGGKDFDRLLINHFNSALKHKYGLNVLETNKKYRLMIKCREIKHTLSVQMDDNLFVDDFKFDEDDVIPITRKEFEDMAVDLILRGKNLITDTLKKAKLNRDEINIVFRVGGGCRIPMIKKMLKEMFPKSQHQCSIHPEELVAKGAALYAYELKNEKNVKDNKSMFF